MDRQRTLQQPYSTLRSGKRSLALLTLVEAARPAEAALRSLTGGTAQAVISQLGSCETQCDDVNTFGTLTLAQLQTVSQVQVDLGLISLMRWSDQNGRNLAFRDVLSGIEGSLRRTL